MSIKASSMSVADTYAQIKRTLVNVSSICKSTVTRIDKGELKYSLLVDDLIPNLKNLGNSLKNPADLSIEWVTAMNDYAASQTVDEIDFLGYYVEIQKEMLETITLCVSKIPSASGYVCTYSLSTDGLKTERTSDNFTEIKSKLNVLIGLID